MESQSGLCACLVRILFQCPCGGFPHRFGPDQFVQRSTRKLLHHAYLRRSKVGHDRQDARAFSLAGTRCSRNIKSGFINICSFLLGTSALMALSTASFASDLEVAQGVPAVPATVSWTGFYAGAQAGVGWRFLDIYAPYGNITGNYSNVTASGFSGGLFGGYNFQFTNRVVVGLEIDASYGEMEGNAPVYRANGSPPTGGQRGMQTAWSGAGRVRVGYAFDRFLPYIAGGIALSDLTTVRSASGAATPLVSWSNSMVGWTLGAGLSYALTNHIVVRAEYRYTDYGFNQYGPYPTPQNIALQKYQLTGNDLRIGVSWRF